MNDIFIRLGQGEILSIFCKGSVRVKTQKIKGLIGRGAEALKDLVTVVVKKDVAFLCRIFFEQQSILGRFLEVQGDHFRSGPVPVVT